MATRIGCRTGSRRRGVPCGSRRDGARGNPLWAIPLENLVATRERPIFSPSRRPPPPAVTVAPPPAPPPPPAPSAPQRPPLELVGTVLNSRDGYGIFLDQATNAIVRLRTGEIHEGWTLRSISGRDAMLQKDRNTVVLALPVPDTGQAGTSDAKAGNQPITIVPATRASAANKQSKPKPIFYPEH